MNRRTVMSLAAFIMGVTLGVVVCGHRKPANPHPGDLRTFTVDYPNPRGEDPPRTKVTLTVYRIIEAGETVYDRTLDTDELPVWRLDTGGRVYFAVAK